APARVAGGGGGKTDDVAFAIEMGVGGRLEALLFRIELGRDAPGIKLAHAGEIEQREEQRLGLAFHLVVIALVVPGDAATAVGR
ncbi:hypothetical protein ABTD55_22690, partial [Acinetobacter baumannii]